MSGQPKKLRMEEGKAEITPEEVSRRTTPDTTSISITLTPLNTTRGS